MSSQGMRQVLVLPGVYGGEMTERAGCLIWLHCCLFYDAPGWNRTNDLGTKSLAKTAAGDRKKLKRPATPASQDCS
jgi:hypothetical protein